MAYIFRNKNELHLLLISCEISTVCFNSKKIYGKVQS